MFIYSVPPIDCFSGLIPLEMVNQFYDLKNTDFKYFFIDGLTNLFNFADYWRPNFKTARIYFGSFPAPYDPPLLFFVIKQSGSGENGASYVVSQHEMLHLSEYENKEKREKTPDIDCFIDFYTKVYDQFMIDYGKKSIDEF